MPDLVAAIGADVLVPIIIWDFLLTAPLCVYENGHSYGLGRNSKSRRNY